MGRAERRGSIRSDERRALARALVESKLHVDRANRSRELGHLRAEPLHLRDALKTLCDAISELDDGVVVFLTDHL